MIDLVFVVLPETLLLDLAGPAEVFRIANQQLLRRGRRPAFRLRHVGPETQASSSVGATIAALEPLPAAFDTESWVVLLGQPSGCESALMRPLPGHWTTTRRWLAEVVAPRLGSGVELMTVCAGALLAADAGLLAGRRCTTHHEMLSELQQLAPSAQVLANRLFVADGPVASSAGVTAGIDLALHAVARICGEAVAAAVAQTLVVFHRRGSEDPQHSPLLAGREHLHPALHRVQDAVLDDPAADWPLARLAAIAHVSPRHLARLFAEHVGSSPREWIEALRVALAERALREGRATKQAVADAGLGGTRQWRRIRARRRPAETPV
ncbi:AraC family transcriptional regulator [Rubrivivax gelatinosus]|uniref:AraC family transcriptional regulator n=1 Tax=Rubrivivax gelatinosus TaxID=28068 RepID=A0ABS1E0T7_RUBGE|nr:helix-turn-helix domain-containing protein [Rubrivivax gelatinosus]MBK1615392.1 AraC family transcriptional regulator [Rubrivivax gelatinosus]MBK1714497.1 AraC family transcriptional regulator [Rubrivivax gelatinosus]